MNKPKQLTFPWSRPNKSSFESFYIDPKNSLLLSIIGNKILSDDIYIFGIKNSGKTYLLQSLCNFYSKHNRTALFLPIKEIISGASIAIAALLLIIPGFFTDTIGFLLLIPFTRKILINAFVKKQNIPKEKDENENILDGEIIEDKDKKDEL